MNNVNNLYNRSFEVEYVLHVMASAAYNVNLQLHTYHKSSSMCIIQTLGSFPMSKNWGLSSPQCFAHWEDKLMSLLGVPPPSRMPTKNQTKTISFNHSWYTLRNIYNKCEVAGTYRK